MAEAEDVITDAARHATAGVQALWRRHRARSAAPPTPLPRLADSLPRLHLLVMAVFGTAYPIRPAQPPARTTLLASLFRRSRQPAGQHAVPATDGACIWLPDDAGTADRALASARWRTSALRQAMRAHRGSAQGLGRLGTALQQDVYLLLEAQAADDALATLLPGLVGPLTDLRRQALAGRPGLATLRGAAQALESLARCLLARPCGGAAGGAGGAGSADAAGGAGGAGCAGCAGCAGGGAASGALAPPSTDASVALARRLAARWQPGLQGAGPQRAPLLVKDAWTGELRNPEAGAAPLCPPGSAPGDSSARPPRSARLSRRPGVRAASDDEDDARQGAWMVQPAQPHEHAEDPLGLQRPTDRDDAAAAEDYAESLADLAQARLVSTPGQAREVLLSDDPPGGRARPRPPAPDGHPAASATTLRYPEWDYRTRAYPAPGATVRLTPAPAGPQAWVEQTLATHRTLLAELRRRFELLRAQPKLQHKWCIRNA